MANNDTITDLFEAATIGDLKTVQYLVEKRKIGVNSKTSDGETALMKASANRRFDVVKFLIQKGANVNQTDERGYSALLSAVDKPPSDFNIVEYLIQNKANVNVQDSAGGYSPLHKVSQEGHLEAVKYLVQNGARIETKTKKGARPIDLAIENNHLDVFEYFIDEKKVSYDVFTAAEKGHTNVVMYFLERKREAVDAYDRNGGTVLHRAASAGQLETVTYLVDRVGVNVNIRSARRKPPATPLHAASAKNHIQIVTYLIERGADVNAADHNGRTALYWAAHNGHQNMVSYFIDTLKVNVKETDDFGSTLLHATCGKGNLELFRYLVEEKKLDINAQDDEGRSPFLECIQRDKPDITEYLIKHTNPSAYVNRLDGNGSNALHYAASKGYISLIKELVNDRGADYLLRNSKGQTPLDLAALAGHLEVVKYLIDDLGANYGENIFSAAEKGSLGLVRYFVEVKNSDVKRTDEQGWTLLQKAAYNGRMNVVKYLSEQVHVDVNDKHGQNGVPFTALHAASQGGHLQIVKYLVEKGSSLTARDVHGRTPLYLAAENGSLEMVKYFLEEKRADIREKRADNGGTLLHVAVSSDNLNLVKYLLKNRELNVDEKANNGETALFRSLIENNLTIFRYLLNEKSANFQDVDKKGRTYLHEAAGRGYIAIVKELVEKGASIKLKDVHGHTPVFEAARGGHLNILRYFVEVEQANVLQKDDEGNTLLHAAALSDNPSVVRYLIEEKGLDMNEKSVDGRTPLFTSIKGGTSHVFHYFLEKSADIRLIDQQGKTCLHEAAVNGRLDMIKTLLDEGADIQAKDASFGRTSALYAAAGTPETGGHLNVVQYFVEEKNVDIHQKDQQGNTMTHLACWYDSLNVLKYLVEGKGMNVNEMNNDGYTPIHFSTERGNKTFHYLLEGTLTDFRITTKNGVTPLHLASTRGDLAIVKALVEKGADIDARDNSGSSPVYYGVTGGNLDVVVYFLDEKKADILQTNQQDLTLLHGAASAGAVNVTRYLVEKKSLNRNAMTKDGLTPLDLALEKHKSDVVTYLKRFENHRNRRHADGPRFEAIITDVPTNTASRHYSLLNYAGQYATNIVSGILSLSSERMQAEAMTKSVTNYEPRWSLVEGVLILLNIGYRKFKPSRGPNVECPSLAYEELLSPTQLIMRRMDPEATVAIHKLPSFD